MLPSCKNSEYYKNHIGRYFNRKTKSDNEYAVCKILDYDSNEKLFFVEHCYLILGKGIVEKCMMNYCFVDADNYCEISENDYLDIKYLCKKNEDIIQ